MLGCARCKPSRVGLRAAAAFVMTFRSFTATCMAGVVWLQGACSSSDGTGTSTSTSTDGGRCPAGAPAGSACVGSQRCIYESPPIGCASESPTFDCIDGKWTRVHFDAGPTATCPTTLPPSGAVCPLNAPCMGDVRGLQCRYGCVTATCFEGAPWTTFSRCDASTDALPGSTDAASQ
jgi:hypothetical protein